MSITLAGEWPDSSIPGELSGHPSIERLGSDIFVNAYSYLGIALPVITPWSMTETLGPLPAGDYRVFASLYHWTTPDDVWLAEGPDPVAQFSVVAVSPIISAVQLNGLPARGAGDIEPSGIGVRTVEVTFSEAVFFDSAAVGVMAVEFSTGVEQERPGGLPAVAVTGSGTNVMTITLGDPAGTVGAVDTWVKVALAAVGITDAAGNALDGEPENDSSGLGYIYDAVEDLPSGDGTPGGDAVFYVGSLRGDMRGVGFTGILPDGLVNVWDINGFVSKYTTGDLDADMRGVGFSQPNPDGVVNVWDINGFVSFYQTAIRNGTHLDPLPTAGTLAPAAAGPLGQAMPATGPSDEANLLALAVASGMVVRPRGAGDEPGAATALPIAAAAVAVPEREVSALNRIEPEVDAGAQPDADLFVWEEGTSPERLGPLPHDLDGDLVDVLELVALDVPLGV